MQEKARRIVMNYFNDHEMACTTKLPTTATKTKTTSMFTKSGKITA